MSTLFSQLKQRWDIAEDASNEDLLSYVQLKLKKDPDNPELLYILAELQRHLGQHEAANKSYKETIHITDQRTHKRGELLEQQLIVRRNNLREKLFLYTLFPFVVILLSSIIFWNISNKSEALDANASNPHNFTFTQWLAKRQLNEIISTLKKQNPELSFNSNGSLAKPQSTMDFLQSLMRPHSLSRLKREQQAAKDRANETGDGKGSQFQCRHEAPIQCAKEDMPLAAGKAREEIALLMQSYWAILQKETNCLKLEKSIEMMVKQLDLRESEKEIKGIFEGLAIECFSRKGDVKNALKHTKKLQCISGDDYINNIYWYQTINYRRSNDIKKAKVAYECYRDALKHVEKKGDITPSKIAARHRESAVLAWLYFDDLPTAMHELITARKVLKKYKDKTPSMLRVISEINLDLMEAYVTDNVDLETFEELLEEVNTSGLLTDPYKQIKDTLTTIYYLQNKNNTAATISLQNLRSRFELIPEFICGWDWDGFSRALDTSIPDEEIRAQARKLVKVSSCEKPQPLEQRIKSIDQVLQWIKAH